MMNNSRYEQLEKENANVKSPENLYRCAAVYSAKNILVYKNGRYYQVGISKKMNGQVLVGDYLLCDSVYGQIYANKIVERKNWVRRLLAGKVQGLAANVNVVFVVTSANQDFNMARLERYYIVAKEGAAKVCFILSKIDLTDGYEELAKEIKERFPECEVIKTSMYASDGNTKLFEHWMPGETAVFLGSSGVGKSTLINSLLDREVTATQAIRESDGRGRHTTTARHMYVLSVPEERYVIDTPGLRSVGISANADTIDELFPEIKELERKCKYNDCSHLSEPGCAVWAALENDELDYECYMRYLKLIGQEKKREVIRSGKVYEKERLLKSMKKSERKDRR